MGTLLRLQMFPRIFHSLNLNFRHFSHPLGRRRPCHRSTQNQSPAASFVDSLTCSTNIVMPLGGRHNDMTAVYFMYKVAAGYRLRIPTRGPAGCKSAWVPVMTSGDARAEGALEQTQIRLFNRCLSVALLYTGRTTRATGELRIPS